MALKPVILMMLAHEEATGYELAGEFDAVVGFFWKATHQQIYRDLAALEAEGLVVHRVEPQSGKPDRKVYRVTPAGLAELKGWLAGPTAMRRTTDELLVKIAAGDLMGLDALARELGGQRELHRQKLDAYLAIEREHYTPRALAAAPLRLRLLHLTLRCGIHAETAWLAWADESLCTLAELQRARSK
ncbi:MAG TPA: PadR family transcriptional regulator [Polyangiaceae bacterium]|nr:PadR family transcriptional regulator [Polyangiaceae bacterium]